MGRTYMEIGILVLVNMLLMCVAASDIDKDKQECTSSLVGLSTCLSYVGGQAKAPTMDCCTGLTQVLKTNKKCLCILVKDRDDPSLSLKINATLALGLPDKCKSPNGDISECPSLLHLAPNSPDAKVFSDFGKPGATSSAPSTKASSSDSTATPIGKGPSNGGVSNKELIVQMFHGVLLSSFIFQFVF